jgi:hypothetical protein
LVQANVTVMREYPGYTLRLSPDLREALQKAAKVAGRSLNAEIAARLSESLEPGKRSREDEPEGDADLQVIMDLLEDIRDRVVRLEEGADTRLRIEKLETAIAEIQRTLKKQ